jgi:hypothetical protein
MRLKDQPSASPASAWECDARYRLYEGGFTCALPADYSDGRNIQGNVGPRTRIVGQW